MNKNKLIELSGEDYLICDDIVLEGINYLYVISLDGQRYSVLKRVVANNEDTVESVTDEAIIKKVLEFIGAEENI